jgi:hypothetical protein
MSKGISGVALSLLAALCAGACGTRTPGTPAMDGGASEMDGEAAEMDGGTSGQDGETPLPATCECEHEWDRQFGGAFIDFPASVSIASGGDVMVSGRRRRPGDDYDRAFLARVDRVGSIVWERQPPAGVPSGYDGPSFAGGVDGDIFTFVRYTEGQDIGGGPRDRGFGIAHFAPDGGLAWDRFLGADLVDLVVEMSRSGQVMAFGRFRGTVDFGGGAHTTPSAESYAAFIAVYAPNGDHVFDQTFAAGDVEVRSVAMDASGSVLAAGVFSGSIDFGGGMRTSLGFRDAFVISFDALGNHLWDRTYGSAQEDGADAVAVSTGGDLAVIGRFSGSVDFGGGLRVPTGAGGNGYVLRLNGQGAHRWDRILEFSSFGGATVVGIDQAENVVIAGAFNERANLGGGERTSAAGNLPVLFIASYHHLDGAYGWDRTYHGGHPSLTAYDLVIAPDEPRLVLTGLFSDRIDFGGGTRSSADQDIFLLSMNCGCGEP